MDELIERLRSARSVFVLTGSGISAESGLPTFRGTGGLWRTHRVEELASPQGFDADPQSVRARTSCCTTMVTVRSLWAR
ncbi:MAG TPA: Sir2 family NAD-dependent protein deacetylase [Candidatus Aquilonibacter sp.]